MSRNLTAALKEKGEESGNVLKSLGSKLKQTYDNSLAGAAGDLAVATIRQKTIVSKEVLEGMTKGKDPNGQNIFHRAANYHNLPLLLNLILDMENEDDLKYSIIEEINSESKYGETPLQIACMLLNDQNEELRYAFISFLI